MPRSEFPGSAKSRLEARAFSYEHSLYPIVNSLCNHAFPIIRGFITKPQIAIVPSFETDSFLETVAGSYENLIADPTERYRPSILYADFGICTAGEGLYRDRLISLFEIKRNEVTEATARQQLISYLEAAVDAGMVKDDRLSAGFEGYLLLGPKVVIYRWSVDRGAPILLPDTYNLQISQQFDEFCQRLRVIGRTEGRECLLDGRNFPVWLTDRIVNIRNDPSHYEHSYISILNTILFMVFPYRVIRPQALLRKSWVGADNGRSSTDSFDRLVAPEAGIRGSGKPDFMVSEYVSPWLDQVKVVVEAKVEKSGAMAWAVDQAIDYCQLLGNAYCDESLALVATQGVNVIACVYSPSSRHITEPSRQFMMENPELWEWLARF